MPRSWGPYDGGKKPGPAHGASVETVEEPTSTAGDGASVETHALEKDRLVWDKFLRTLKPNAVRQSHVEKMPEHLAANMVTMPGKKKWFRLWIENGCSWRQLAETVGETSPAGAQEETPHELQWLTLQEIEVIYKDKEIAKSIADSKRVLGHYRAHPSTPTNLAKIQYKVRVDKKFEAIRGTDLSP